MKYTLYQVDAFAREVFTGNPAAVCPLREWLSDDILQSIAMENNLAETVFYVPAGDHFEIHWFTPTVEVDLCGHATLAAAYVLMEAEGYQDDLCRYFTRPAAAACRCGSRASSWPWTFPPTSTRKCP